MKGKTTICRDCIFAVVDYAETFLAEGSLTLTGICCCPKAPVTDFVQGLRKCSMINRGRCEFFRKKMEVENDKNTNS